MLLESELVQKLLVPVLLGEFSQLNIIIFEPLPLGMPLVAEFLGFKLFSCLLVLFPARIWVRLFKNIVIIEPGLHLSSTFSLFVPLGIRVVQFHEGAYSNNDNVDRDVDGSNPDQYPPHYLPELVRSTCV